MSKPAYSSRYQTFPADALPAGGVDAAAVSGAEATPSSEGSRILTYVVLTACLMLWSVLGFLFWVPRVVSSMLRFTFDLCRGMLSGNRPVKAGRDLREAVAFYRRGFAVAIQAVIGEDEPETKSGAKKSKVARLDARALLFDVLWSGVFWYLFLYAIGSLQASPLDGWIALFQLPWTEMWGAAEDRVLAALTF